VLRGVDLAVADGELVVMLGRSGSGKSTLLNLVAGIEPPSGGRVEVGGVDLGALPERRRTLFRRDRVGFVFQCKRQSRKACRQRSVGSSNLTSDAKNTSGSYAPPSHWSIS
jgi:predicted ABC-type transport system involved in lysophospholipase L1 biosynthesis ATPase subunit